MTNFSYYYLFFFFIKFFQLLCWCICLVSESRFYKMILTLKLFKENQTAVGTGFGQVFKGIGKGFSFRRCPSLLTQFILSGQVGGVAISSAIFQSSLESQLRSRIHRPDSEDVRPMIQIHYIYLIQSLIVFLARPAN